MRKYWFAYLAKALVVFPGGFGTLDEMFELLTLAQTHKLAKKMTIVIYGAKYWKNVIDLELLAEKGAIAVNDVDLFQFADTPEEAFRILKDGLTKNHLELETMRDEAPIPRQSGAALWSAQEVLGPDIARTGVTNFDEIGKADFGAHLLSFFSFERRGPSLADTSKSILTFPNSTMKRCAGRVWRGPHPSGHLVLEKSLRIIDQIHFLRMGFKLCRAPFPLLRKNTKPDEMFLRRALARQPHGFGRR